MIYDWYKIFSLTEWLATGLVARTLIVSLESKGRTSFEITQGNETGVTYEDGFFPVNLRSVNPYVLGDRAVYLDSNGDIWFGFAAE